MAYNTFTLKDVRVRLGISVDDVQGTFAPIEPVEVSDVLRQYLRDSAPLALAFGTEKARSEMIVSPILMEVWRQRKGQMSLFSGADFNVDPERGLVGYCDFLLSTSRQQLELEAPLVAVVEAKKEDLNPGTPQCIAEMVAVRTFNAREGREVPIVYGAVTSGSNWRFLRLQGDRAEIDLTEYYLADLGRIVGILVRMMEGRA